MVTIRILPSKADHLFDGFYRAMQSRVVSLCPVICLMQWMDHTSEGEDGGGGVLFGDKLSERRGLSTKSAEIANGIWDTQINTQSAIGMGYGPVYPRNST